MRPSTLVRVSLIFANVLVPLAHAQTVTASVKRTGSLHVMDLENVQKGWVDKGTNAVGQQFRMIPDSAYINDHPGDQGSFFYKITGGGNAVEIFCSRCGTADPNNPVDLQLGTALGQFSGYTVWFPIAVTAPAPGTEYLPNRRGMDPSLSFWWTVDTAGNVVPMLKDANGVSQTAGLNTAWDGPCINLYSYTNCDIWWGPNAGYSDGLYLSFVQTGTEPIGTIPDDVSKVLCI